MAKQIIMNKKIFNFENYGVAKHPVPSGEVYIVNPEGEDAYENYNLDQYIGDRNVILVGIPGAFTPTCTEKHLPGFVSNEKNIYNAGIDEIICMSVNDPHVMVAFEDYINFDGSTITMAADPYGEVAEQMLLLTDMGVMGNRSKRFAAIINSGKIQTLLIDENGLDISSAENK